MTDELSNTNQLTADEMTVNTDASLHHRAGLDRGSVVTVYGQDHMAADSVSPCCRCDLPVGESSP